MKTELIPFHGETITTIETADGIFVPVKPLTERFGVSNQGQQAKFNAEPERWSIKMILMETAAGPRETMCLPLNRIAAWLFTLNANKVKPEVADALRLYQREAADVLDAHFRLRMSRDEAALRQVIIDQGSQLSHCHAHLMSALPKWSRIKELSAIGTAWPFIAKRCSLSGEQYAFERQAMEDCGLFAATERGSGLSADTSLAAIRRLEAALTLAKGWPERSAVVATSEQAG